MMGLLGSAGHQAGGSHHQQESLHALGHDAVGVAEVEAQPRAPGQLLLAQWAAIVGLQPMLLSGMDPHHLACCTHEAAEGAAKHLGSKGGEGVRPAGRNPDVWGDRRNPGGGEGKGREGDFGIWGGEWDPGVRGRIWGRKPGVRGAAEKVNPCVWGGTQPPLGSWKCQANPLPHSHGGGITSGQRHPLPPLPHPRPGAHRAGGLPARQALGLRLLHSWGRGEGQLGPEPGARAAGL